ncbi:cysteine desulfurase [Caenimonas sedimenti]|uniref:cysteine desulfurase n=1 Tax=Caenimonas sedimenti TaxID=2596921 RepID=A0A562ZI75_9BURK|nr:cysteine desulfurase family protein [Caenimonas sedimenti]TWO68036.1 cysteine desulfurase [Caenimonas sedimenti]
MSASIYLDYNATTPVAPEVAEAIQPFLYGLFGNPSSSHSYGRAAADAMAGAKHQVARLIGAEDDEIVFTGTATEANNTALLGAASALADTARRHIVVSAVEHPAVMQPVLHLRSQGWDVSLVPVDSAGCVLMSAIDEALRPDTALVSIMHANNEVGTIQPLAEIARRARALGILVHTDAAQSIGKIGVNVDALGVDLLTMAGHKFYAPKGIGALYVRRGTPLRRILFGADQEWGLRPGTENVALSVGLGVAAELAHKLLPQVGAMRRKRDALHEQLTAQVPGLQLNGHFAERLPNTLNVSFPGVDGADLLARAPQVAASTGSACHSGRREASGVLAAMGKSYEAARGAVRLSVGRDTTDEDVQRAAQGLVQAWRQLREA